MHRTLSLIAALCLIPCSQAQELSPQQRERNQQSFEKVWKTIRDAHWDPKLGGLDWDKVRAELEPKAKSAESMSEFRGHLNEMIGRLGQSHFAIIPAQAYQAIQNEKDKTGNDPSARDVPGFDVRVVGGKVLVVKIEPDSPAFKLGVRPGWQLTKIQDQEMDTLLAKVKGVKRPEVEQMVAVVGRLRGRAGQKKSLTFRVDNGDEKIIDVPFMAPKGTPAKFGHLPVIYVNHKATTIDNTIGYFHLTAFFDPTAIMKALESAIAKHRQGEGFVIDLRGNPGGIGAMAMGFGGWFVEKSDLKLGTMTTRQGDLHFVLFPRLEPFPGPLAVLVDCMSGSTSEILAGGLQDLKRARVFGSRTMGAALPSQIILLPNGDGFQYAFANYVSFGGKPLEGNGVVPDEEVTLSREALLEGRDPVLDAAVRWIRSQKTK